MIRSIFSRFLLALIVMAGSTALAQTTYQVGAGTEFFIDGTSNIHDWTATVGQVEGRFTLAEDFIKKGKVQPGVAFTAGSFRIPIETIDGGKGETMNNKILAAFDAPNHPHIAFELTVATVGSRPDAQGEFPVTVSGQLTMAGQTRPVSFSLSGQQQTDGSLRFSGQHPLLMTSFGMDPPTALFGQIATGDEVVIRFTLVLKSAA